MTSFRDDLLRALDSVLSEPPMVAFNRGEANKALADAIDIAAGPGTATKLVGQTSGLIRLDRLITAAVALLGASAGEKQLPLQ